MQYLEVWERDLVFGGVLRQSDPLSPNQIQREKAVCSERCGSTGISHASSDGPAPRWGQVVPVLYGRQASLDVW
jgi:hypothetical protein